ncbi:hypothetical protein [Bacillus pumilus]|uniref:Uncharacterized protein n=1 Tax=Bacillus pumilus TaxID=1408 RepID=A0AAD0MNH3_BACPU|nr:hypothetical protein [Bacillus pumilus]AVM25993.1 hypothetical protein C5695_19900 [Bacillus pumilus]TYS41084.1 hypothetical protein FZC68_14280 [Bacillus pumilus]
MKIELEFEQDVTKYYKWLDQEINELKKLSVYSINGYYFLDDGGIKTFQHYCQNELIEIFSDKLINYDFYIFLSKKVSDIHSRIENYRKVWKYIDSEINTSGFEKGPELLLDEHRNHFYVSIAKVPQHELDKALRIMDQYQSSFLIATRRDTMLSEEAIKDLFYSGLNKDSHEVDYQALFLKYGLNSEIIFRWGSVVNEAELAMILNKDLTQKIR